MAFIAVLLVVRQEEKDRYKHAPGQWSASHFESDQSHIFNGPVIDDTLLLLSANLRVGRECRTAALYAHRFQKMRTFQDIHSMAIDRKGGRQALDRLMPAGILSAESLKQIPDDRYLSAMTKAVFKAGFVWRVIDQKWPEFETAFFGFDVPTCMHLSAEDEERLLGNAAIVRNRQKIVTVPKNAAMMTDIAAGYGSFANYVADWPDEDFAGLLQELRRNGSRLGGITAQYFLRSMGKDGYILGRDGVHALINAGVIDLPPVSNKAMQAVQRAFNRWHDESGRGYADISRILSCSVDAPV